MEMVLNEILLSKIKGRHDEVFVCAKFGFVQALKRKLSDGPEHVRQACENPLKV